MKNLNFFNEWPEEGKEYIEVIVTKKSGELSMSVSAFRAEKVVREEFGDRSKDIYLRFTAVPMFSTGASPSDRYFLVGHPSHMEKLDAHLLFPYSAETLAVLQSFEEKQCVCEFYEAIGKKFPDCLKESESGKTPIITHPSRPAVVGGYRAT